MSPESWKAIDARLQSVMAQKGGEQDQYFGLILAPPTPTPRNEVDVYRLLLLGMSNSISFLLFALLLHYTMNRTTGSLVRQSIMRSVYTSK